MKGEFFKGERLYKIDLLPLYERFINTTQFNYLKQFIIQMAQTLSLLAEENIVHCDIKPENILVTDNGERFQQIKLIDYGSCFNLSEKGSIMMATAEYMPHEVLEVLSNTSKLALSQTQLEYLQSVIHPWSIDIWSLGIVIIELLSGIPNWLCYKCRVTR